jgi:hypothetical protein
MTESDRFWDQVDTTGICWDWQGSTSDGYGLFGRSDRHVQQAHRYAYEDLVGPIPDELQLDHLCRNRRCVNPDHVEIVTNRINALRGFGVSGINARQTHCIHGHPFDEANTYYKPDGGRQCRACRRETDKSERRRNRPRRGVRALKG